MNGSREPRCVDEYLRTLGEALPVSGRAKRSILAEVGDGLYCALEAHAQRGLEPAGAARAAVAEFGDPGRLAADFSKQLSSACARPTGLALVLTGPFVGMTWALAVGAGTHWLSNVVGLLEEVPALPLALLVGIPAAVLATRGSTLNGGSTAMVAAVAATLGDALLLGWLLAHASTATGILLVAAGLSLTRVALAIARVQRIARLRAASR